MRALIASGYLEKACENLPIYFLYPGGSDFADWKPVGGLHLLLCAEGGIWVIPAREVVFVLQWQFADCTKLAFITTYLRPVPAAHSPWIRAASISASKNFR